MSVQAEKILKEFHLRNTNCRVDTLAIFIKNPFALSNADIEREIGEVYDRVTVYRTLKTFLDKGLIHKVLDDSGNLKYALCSHACHQEAHNHQHVHFKCIRCGLTNCLDSVEIPAILLPKGYQSLEANLLVQGVCSICNQ
jgi:Fur family ferric uptake transcriptional regulator